MAHHTATSQVNHQCAARQLASSLCTPSGNIQTARQLVHARVCCCHIRRGGLGRACHAVGTLAPLRPAATIQEKKRKKTIPATLEHTIVTLKGICTCWYTQKGRSVGRHTHSATQYRGPRVCITGCDPTSATHQNSLGTFTAAPPTNLSSHRHTHRHASTQLHQPPSLAGGTEHSAQSITAILRLLLRNCLPHAPQPWAMQPTALRAPSLQLGYTPPCQTVTLPARMRTTLLFADPPHPSCPLHVLLPPNAQSALTTTQHPQPHRRETHTVMLLLLCAQGMPARHCTFSCCTPAQRPSKCTHRCCCCSRTGLFLFCAGLTLCRAVLPASCWPLLCCWGSCIIILQQQLVWPCSSHAHAARHRGRHEAQQQQHQHHGSWVQVGAEQVDQLLHGWLLLLIGVALARGCAAAALSTHATAAAPGVHCCCRRSLLVLPVGACER